MSEKPSAPKALIRLIEKKDKEEWIELFGNYLHFRKTTIPEPTIESTFERFCNPSIPLNCFVAVNPDDNKLIGFATFLTHYNTLSPKLTTYLSDLFVSPHCRLAGTGKSLIHSIYDWADENDSDKVHWNTHFQNHRAQMLYIKVGKKSGFLSYRRPTGAEKPDYYSSEFPNAI